MGDTPRFQAEYFIRKSLEELQYYASVFHERIAPAFDGLDDEAKRIEVEEYTRLGQFVDPDYADPSDGAEQAYFKGVDFYLATDAVRQGLFNLMIAGLFHLLEQQAQYLATRILSNSIVQPDGSGGFQQLKALVSREFHVNIESFPCWPQLNELRLVTNTVKHGDGRSSDELKALNPALFKDPSDPLPQFHGLPLRPLVGEGLRLTSDHFNTYKTCLEQFWSELTAGLLPIFCPPPQTPTS